MEIAEDAVRAYMLRPHDIIVYPDVMEDGTIIYMGMDPGLPGCMSDGRTPEEAAANLEDARAVYIRGLLARGTQPPERVGTSAGTSMSYRSVSVILSCCEPADTEVPELQRHAYNISAKESVA